MGVLLEPEQPLTVLDVLGRAEGFLRDRGSASPRLDAQMLLAHVLACDRVRLYMDYAKPLKDDERAAYREAVRRRANGEPVAYLVGEREFWSLPFAVDGRVLIPRPDSETLIEQAQSLFEHAAPTNFADVGTGSGCLAAALASAFPDALGLAIDACPEALQVAGENLAKLGFAGRVELRQGHLLEPLTGERVDLICANLPYIPSADIQGLPEDVRDHEPRRALDGGPDGLDLIRELVLSAPGALKESGCLLLEVGQGQAKVVADLCRQAGFGQVGTRADLGGIARVVSAQRVSPSTFGEPLDG